MSDQVLLHVYDVTNWPEESTNKATVRINNVARYWCLGGYYHGAIEVYGDEYSYAYTRKGSGVYKCLPKDNPLYTFRETIVLGKTTVSRSEASRIMEAFKRNWNGLEYSMKDKNCNHFCDEVAMKLGVQRPPGWLNRFAVAAATLFSLPSTVLSQAKWVSDRSANWVRWLGAQISAKMH
jgi:hypothetical protein